MSNVSGLVGTATVARRRTRRTTVAAWTAGTVTAVLVAGGFGLGLQLANLHNGLIAASFTAVGLVVVRQRPAHREGWLFVAVGTGHAVMFFGRQVGLHEGDLPGQAWLAWLGVWPLASLLVLAGVAFMCFPTGRLPSPGWRVVVGAMVVAGVGLSLVSALWPVEYAATGITLPPVIDLGGTASVQPVYDLARKACYPLFQLAWVLCLVVRLRRTRGEEAAPLKWFVLAVVAGAVAMVVGLVVLHTHVVGVLAVPLVAAAAGVAIVRHRLYDIDVVINKALVVGAMAAAITFGYVLVVVGVGRLFGVSAGPGPALPLVATALVAVGFEPVRRRVQRAADRLVYGARPTPYESLARLSTHLSGGPADDLFAGLAATVGAAVGAATVTLWVGGVEDLVAVASWPPGQPLVAERRTMGSLEEDARAHVRPIVHQGCLQGAITLTKTPGDALSAQDDRLLADLVAQAGLVFDHRDLGAELQRRLQEIAAQAADLRAAAKRIVTAQYDARRRIERDLHDGAQQRLVTLAMSLRAAQDRAAESGAADLAGRLGRMRTELAAAIDDLREMARGIHPAILTQDGLAAALDFLAERSPVPVRLALDLDRRLASEVEATAYFVVGEALTNAAKHADATSVVVTGGLEGDLLVIEVADDGRGGAVAQPGSGLQGLADRLATLDGRLTVDSRAGAGTRLRVEIPCG